MAMPCPEIPCTRGCTGSPMLHTGFSPVAAQRQLLSSCGVQLLFGMVSLVVEQGPSSLGSIVVVHELSCPPMCEIFPDQGSKL